MVFIVITIVDLIEYDQDDMYESKHRSKRDVHVEVVGVVESDCPSESHENKEVNKDIVGDGVK